MKKIIACLMACFAGHLLINKEAYPIPILPVRIPFLNTVANPLLAL